MAKISQKLKEKIWISTQVCYCRALKELYPEILKHYDEPAFNLLGCDREMRSAILDAGLEDRSEEIHRLYMKHVLELSTKELELIIRADKEGAIRRAPYTIDEIMYELLDRAANPKPKENHE